jgi:hypothetical protein
MLRRLFIALMVAAPAAFIGADEKPAAKDQFILYRTAGRTWTIRRIPKEGTEGGNFGNTYMKYDVTGVWDDRAEVAQTLLDSGTQSAEPTIIKVGFEKDDIIFKDPVGFQKNKLEKITVAAGTFECVRWVSSLDGGAALWTSTEYPSLIVKSDDRFGTRDLQTFDFVEGEPGHKPDKKKKKKAQPKEIPRTRLFGGRGHRWILKTTTKRGKYGSKAFEVKQFEITKADDKGCTLEVTPMTLTLEKTKGAEVERHTIDFETQLNDWLEPRRRAKVDRTERRLTAFGLFTCTVYEYVDDEKRQCYTWYANEWPGLIVRQTVTGEEYDQVTELVAFDD